MDLERRRMRTIVLISVQLVIAFVVWRQTTHSGPGYHLDSDPGRYRAIVTAAGTPYRDFPVEYPPGALGLFHALGPHSFNAFVEHLILFNVACQAAITYMLWKVWGERAMWSYLALSAPLMPILYTRYDLFSVVVAMIGMFLLARRKAVGAGVCWAAAAFIKLWPSVLIPSLAARQQFKAFIVSLVVGAVGLVAWVIWGGTAGPRQVATYRGAHGWEFESVPGSILRLITRGEVHLEQGAWRLGAPPGVLSALLSLTLMATVVATWIYVYRHPVRNGVAEVVAITAVLVTGTLLSPQFIVWVMPFVAITAAAGVRRIEVLAGVVVALTFIDWWMFDVNHAQALGVEVVVVMRSVALVAMFVVAVVELRRGLPVTAAEREPALDA